MDSHTAFYFPPSANKDRAVKGASFCKLSFSQISYSYVFVKWKKCNILPSFLLIHIVDSTFHHPPGVGWSPSLSREGNVLQSFLWYSFYLLTIRRGIAENSRYTFFDEDISIEEKINNAISQNEFELIRAGARRFPVLERKGGPPAFGWWGKVDFCMLEQRGILLKRSSFLERKGDYSLQRMVDS